MQINEVLLKQMIPDASTDQIKKFMVPLADTMERYQINTTIRIACFMAQITHESGSLRYVKELASGRAYEGRKDLGNIHTGDGVRFKGRGLIQVTGRDNYTRVAKELNIDCVNHPELLEQPEYAALTAGWFWNMKGLNKYADQGDMQTITRRINGGLNGFEYRMEHFRRCKTIMSL